MGVASETPLLKILAVSLSLFDIRSIVVSSCMIMHAVELMTQLK